MRLYDIAQTSLRTWQAQKASRDLLPIAASVTPGGESRKTHFVQIIISLVEIKSPQTLRNVWCVVCDQNRGENSTIYQDRQHRDRYRCKPEGGSQPVLDLHVARNVWAYLKVLSL